ncbi:unnamed protein product, partial [marine sediment metagenome]
MNQKQIMNFGIIGAIAAAIIFVGGTLTIMTVMEPRNFEDCVIQGMKNVGTESASVAIERSCENKFKSPNARKMDQQLKWNVDSGTDEHWEWHQKDSMIQISY